MFDFLLRKWVENDLSEAEVDYAVEQIWITSEEGAQIKNTPKNNNSEVID